MVDWRSRAAARRRWGNLVDACSLTAAATPLSLVLGAAITFVFLGLLALPLWAFVIWQQVIYALVSVVRNFAVLEASDHIKLRWSRRRRRKALQAQCARRGWQASLTWRAFPR